MEFASLRYQDVHRLLKVVERIVGQMFVVEDQIPEVAAAVAE